MADGRNDAPPRLQLALKCAVLAAMVAVVGLPINDLFSYALLAIAVIVLALGRITAKPKSWLIAAAVLAVALVARMAIEVPRIDEGHNVFLPGGSNNALTTGLPADAYAAMSAEFDAAYPPAGRCDAKISGCWQGGERPGRAYAFSFDGIYDRTAYSRRVTGIDFTHTEWQRLGFINEVAYNWNEREGGLGRAQRQRGLRALLHPWRITMPHFVMYRFPAAFAGSQLCWQGKVLWEGADERFTRINHIGWACRELGAGDAGKRIFGLAIAPAAPLSMKLRPTADVQVRQYLRPATAAIIAGALLFLLVRWNPRRLLLPLTLVGLCLVVIAASDSTLLGGLRPFDSGNDGLVYDGWSRIMAQQLLSGDIVGALQGLEPVFYFTPGSRYLRLLEHLIFGESYFGYVSLLLLMPFLVFALFRRFFTARTALAFVLIFVAIPVGALFGSTFYIYVKHAAHGYGDPAAAILFVAAIVGLIGRSQAGPSARFLPALGAAFLFAVAVFVRPNLAVGTAVMLGGAGLACLYQRQYRRLAGLCIGFLPVFSMALHNWYYGGEFVLFSRHTNFAEAMPMPPLAYVAALGELVRLDVSGEHLRAGILQIGRLLIGPSESAAMIPLHIAAFAIIVRVMLSRLYEGWLRLIAGATLGLYLPGLFFIYSDRYHIVAWLLTLLVCCVWARDEALVWIERKWPGGIGRVQRHSPVAFLARRLDEFARKAGLVGSARTPTSAR